MMNLFKKTLLLFVLLVSTTCIMAQQQTAPQGFMRSAGRSYVVIAVMLTILIGLILYMVRIDRKLTKLEKE